MQDGLPSFREIQQHIESESGIRRLKFDTQDLSSWDSGFITFLLKILDLCSKKAIEVDRSSLPDGVQRLLNLATAVPERKGAKRTAIRASHLSKIGIQATTIRRRCQRHAHLYW